jgi:hypothetical protein
MVQIHIVVRPNNDTTVGSYALVLGAGGADSKIWCMQDNTAATCCKQ